MHVNETTRRGLIFGAATLVASGLLLGVQRICSSAFADADDPPDENGQVQIKQFGADGTAIGLASVRQVYKSQDEWKKQLTPLQFEVTRLSDTEWAFTGALDKEYGAGL